MHQRLSEGRFYGELLRERVIDGLHLTETRYTAGTRLPRHCHAHGYFCLVRRGQYREQFGGQQRLCGPLTLAYHPPEEIHSESFEGNVWSFNISLSPSWLSRAAGAALAPQPSAIQGGWPVSLALRLYEEFQRADAATPLIVQGLVMELLGHGIRSARLAAAGRAPAWLRRVREVLREHHARPPTLAELAAEAGVHPGHVATAFRQHFGCTVGHFVREQRVAQACQQLMATAQPLAEIALAAGFADQSHFTRTFKRVTGLTPAAYRKQLGRPALRSRT